MTPGPWKVSSEDPCIVEQGLGEGPLNGFVAMTLPDPALGWNGTERNYADAKAIAALPDLLNAVKRWLKADKLTPGDCYDASGNPNANWGEVDRAKSDVRIALEKGGGAPVTLTIRADADVIARHVKGCTIVIEQPRHEWGERRAWWNAHVPSSRNVLAQADTAEELEAWARECGAKRVEVFP